MTTGQRTPRRRAGSREAIRASSPLLRVALAQLNAEPGDCSGNIAKAKRLISEHRGRTDLLVFPEYFVTGYVTGQDVYNHALRTDDALFQELVKSTDGIMIAITFIEETGAFNFYDSVAFVADGRIVGIHRKIYLVSYGVFDERRHFSVGPNHHAIDHGAFRIAPFVCADAWSPALVHLAAADLAHIFVFSACSPTQGLGSRLSTKESWHRMNQFYASMYGVYVLFVNRVGNDKDLTFWGGSQVIDPFGKIIAQAKGDAEEIIEAELRLTEVRESRTVLHTVRDENLNFLVHRLQHVIQSNYSSVEAQDL